MEYQVEGESITPAELEADSRWIRAVKAHRAAAAHQPITSTPPPSTPSQKTTPPPNTTTSATTLRRHAPLPRLPAEDFKIVFRPGGGLHLRTATNGVLLQTLCSLATIDYATARTADRVRINPYNNSLTVSTPSESRARLYLRVSELRLGTISYPLRAYMAAPDNALRGIIYNAVDSQTQGEIIQDLQSMNVNTLRHHRCAPDGALEIHPHHLRRHYHPPLLDRLQLRSLPLPPVPSESRGLHELLDSWPSRGRLHQAQVHPVLPLRPDPRDS
ncbi:hypothetical protein MTO96_051914 [Rhipicephalus appendiculatus]